MSLLIPDTPPLALGTKVKPWGTVEAVGITGGERYYWLIDKHGTVSMMPACVVEPNAHEKRTP